MAGLLLRRCWRPRSASGGRLEAALAEEQGRRQDAEASLQLAARDAQEATHREAQALADLEKAIEEVTDLHERLRDSEAALEAQQAAAQAAQAAAVAAAAAAPAELSVSGKKQEAALLAAEDELGKLKQAARSDIRQLQLELVNSKTATEQQARDLAAAEAENEALRRQLQQQAEEAASVPPASGPKRKGKKAAAAAAPQAVEADAAMDSGAATATALAGQQPAAEAALAQAQAEAEAAAAAAQQRVFEIRAEAAMLVETVEDRAHEAVVEAEGKTKLAEREVQRLRAQLRALGSRDDA